MFKINSFSFFFLTVLFLNNPRFHAFSSSRFNHGSSTSMQSLFPDIFQETENDDSIHPLFPVESNVTPQPYNLYFNSSTDTFMHPFMLSGWDPNSSTNAFNTNNLSLPFMRENANCNDASVDTNHNTPLSFLPHAEEVSHTNQVMNHVLSKKNKSKKHTKTYTCPTCNKQIVNQSSFNYHLKTHDPDRARPYHCTICDKSFTEKYILKTHIKRHNKEKIFKCDYCSKCFKTKHERIAHHRTHTGEKPYQCKLCGQCFSIQATLQYHQRTHTGDKPFKCEICQKRLTSRHSLQYHLNWHLDKKPYKCEECNKGFRGKSKLNQHRKVHKDKKSYKCAHCRKVYATKNGLKYHMKTHNRPISYSCRYCNVAFTHKGEYESHIRYEETTDDDCKCHICKKAYAYKYNLARHNKRVHPINS